MKNKRINAGLFVLVLSLVLLQVTGCGSTDSKETAEETQTKTIAVLGWDEYLQGNEPFINGMEMALEDSKEEINLNWEYYNDEGDYEQGVLMAQQLAEDEHIAAVLTFQDFEVIDAEAHYFDEEEKPLIIVQGCYEKTLEQGLQYVFSPYVSSKDMGAAMARYCAEQGYERVACSHTDTIFELDEMKGFCKEAESKGISVVDMQIGPDTLNSLESAYKKWKNLGIRALYICRYTETEEQKDWIFKMIEYIKKRDPEFLIMGDYSLDGAEYLKKYGKNMENVAYPNPYSIQKSDKAEKFAERYREKYPEETGVADGAYQGYDIAKMIAEALVDQGQNTATAGQRIRDFFKKKEGYQGVSGTLTYSEAGKLSSQIEYYRVHNSVFVTEGSYE